MSIKGQLERQGGRWLLAAGVSALLGVASPALAQGHSGGGGHMGGGHFGGHASSHAAVGHVAGGAHFAGVGHFAGGGAVAHNYGAGFHGSAYGGRGAYGYPGGGGYGHGYSTGAYWRGGYWRGGYWPRAYYGLGFSWFLPVLPLAYATYWYGSVPYYYANDVYYTWNPGYNGYIATDPPPVADSSAAGAEGAAVPPTDMGANATQTAPVAGATMAGQPSADGQIFMYPKNGQNMEQQSTDKRECQQWAASQAGADAANAADYQRAMVACIEGRGYSAR